MNPAAHIDPAASCRRLTVGASAAPAQRPADADQVPVASGGPGTLPNRRRIDGLRRECGPAVGPVLLLAGLFAVPVPSNLQQELAPPLASDRAAAHARRPLIRASELPADARSAR